MVGFPVVSIITVCKNPGHSLLSTLKSVSEQTYKNIEYIIIDSCSTDGTIEVCHQWKSSISCFISEEDAGIYDAMNKGIQLATGQFILFLNAGDHLICEYAIETLLNKVKNSSVDIFFAKIIWVDTSQKNIIVTDHSSLEDINELKHQNFPHPATLYRRSSFVKYGLFSLRFTILADYEWNLRALIEYKAPFSYLDTVVSIFYTGGVSTNENMRLKREREIKEIHGSYFPIDNKISIKLGQKFNVFKKKLNKVM